MEKMFFIVLIILVLFQFVTCENSGERSWNISCEHTTMTNFLKDIAERYDSITRLVSIGKTEQDRDIWTMIVSDSPNKRPLLRPQVKFVGNVNGMSGPACYLLLRLIQHLVEEYTNEASMERKLLENMEIHIIPNLNPDGYAQAVPGDCNGKAGRLNANKVNLNTNFPDIFNLFDEPAFPLQKETEAMMRWMDENKFTISVSVISGAQVVVYPFDTIIDDEEITFNGPHFTPDNDIFQHLSLKYAEKTGAPEHGWYCPIVEKEFPNGIINGAEWKPQSGTMMDYNYIHGTFEIMVAVSCCRNENNLTLLDNLWWRNREGLLHVIQEVEGGIRGQVLDSESYDAIHGAKLYKKKDYNYEIDEEIPELELPWYTTSLGEFWRPWRPGRYILRVEKEGYKMKEIPVEVQRRQATFLRVELEKMESTTIPTTTTTAATTTTTSKHIQTTKETEAVFSHKLRNEEEDDEGDDDVIYPKLDYPLDSNKTEDLTNSKQYSSLTQLEHSFINLLRGLQLRNSGISSKSCLSYTLPFKILTFTNFLIGFL